MHGREYIFKPSHVSSDCIVGLLLLDCRCGIGVELECQLWYPAPGVRKWEQVRFAKTLL